MTSMNPSLTPDETLAQIASWPKRKRTRFLNLWWNYSPTSFSMWHSKAQGRGLLMIQELFKSRIDIYSKIEGWM